MQLCCSWKDSLQRQIQAASFPSPAKESLFSKKTACKANDF